MTRQDLLEMKAFGRRELSAAFDTARDQLLRSGEPSGCLPPPWADLPEPVSMLEMQNALRVSAIEILHVHLEAMLRK